MMQAECEEGWMHSECKVWSLIILTRTTLYLSSSPMLFQIIKV